jgi:hypothetical protein
LEKKLVKSGPHQQTQRGEASERILFALAADAPALHDRSSFLKSAALKHEYRKGGDEEQELTVKEQNAIMKTLGRLIAGGAIGEVLILRGNHSKVELGEAGLVAISISLTSMKKDFEEWKTNGHVNGNYREPTQENVIHEILTLSRIWLEKKRGNGEINIYPVNISIVHGSSAFDILITVLYRHSQDFMQYVREVVQRASHVDGTHTMQISSSRGFPDIHGESPEGVA